MGIQTIGTYPASVPSWGERCFSAYLDTVKKIIAFIRSYGYHAASDVIGTQLVEPCASLASSLAFPLGWCEKFQYYGLNPDRLTPEQVKKRPLILIHGNYHNQSAWLALAAAIQNSYGAPVYTVNLHNGPLTEKDRAILKAKFEEIKRQYAEHGVYDVQIDIGGHSRGATMAFLTALVESCWHIDEEGKIKVSLDRVAWRDDIGRVFRIGSSTTPEQDAWIDDEMREKIFEIDAVYDCLVPERSMADPDHRAEIDCGHLGLVHSNKMCKQIIHWLKAEIYSNIITRT